MIVLRSHKDLNTDGRTGMPILVMNRPFASVTQAIAAAIRDQASGWYRCHEIIQDGIVLFPFGEKATEWAREWDK